MMLLELVLLVCGISAFQTARSSKAEFLKDFGDFYGYDGSIDTVYEREVAPRLPSGTNRYMDWTAAALYLNSQIEDSMNDFKTHLYGNPHSAHTSSTLTTARIEKLREELLLFFGADPTEYTLAFTRSATGSLDLIGQLFPWSERSSFVHSRSNHNSVLGIREYVKRAGGQTVTIDENEIDQWINKEEGEGEGVMDSPIYSLFAYPLYDNLGGVIYPRSWTTLIRLKPNRKGHRWLVLADTAAYVPHHPLNLSSADFKPDFAVISFYKLFGHPTGIGALLIRKEIEPLLSKPYWGGGSIFTATSELQWKLTHDFPRSVEDGTVPYLDILALGSGLRAIESLGGISRVHDHVQCLGQYLYTRLSALNHSNGRPMVRVFGRWAEQEDCRKKGAQKAGPSQGPTLNFQILKPTGDVFSYKNAEVLLSSKGIDVRSGCACNPGACYSSLGIHDWEVRDLAERLEREGDPGWEEKWEWIDVERLVGGVKRKVRLPLGALRASLGFMSRWEDADDLTNLIDSAFRDENEEPLFTSGFLAKEQKSSQSIMRKFSWGPRRFPRISRMFKLCFHGNDTIRAYVRACLYYKMLW